MSKTSNWDDQPEAGASASPKHVHDGFDDSAAGHQLHEANDDVVDVPVSKKKGGDIKVKIALAVMVLFVIGIAVYFGMALLSPKVSPSHKAAAHPAKGPMNIDEPAQAGMGKGTVLMGGDPSPVGAPPSMKPAALLVVPANQAVTAVVPVNNQVATVVPAIAATQPAQPVQMTQRSINAVPDAALMQANARVRSLEEENRVLHEKLQATTASLTQTNSASVKSASKGHRAREVLNAEVGSTAAPVVAKHALRHSKAVKTDSAMVIEQSEPEQSSEIARLQLRGVFPRSGDDMQAWVMDGEKTRTLSKGDVINGAKVLRVEADRVVTTQGSIR